MLKDPFDLSRDVNVTDNACHLLMHEWTCLFCSNFILPLFLLIWFQTELKGVHNSPDWFAFETSEFVEACACTSINQWIPCKVSGDVINSSIQSPVTAQHTTTAVCLLTPVYQSGTQSFFPQDCQLWLELSYDTSGCI